MGRQSLEKVLKYSDNDFYHKTILTLSNGGKYLKASEKEVNLGKLKIMGPNFFLLFSTVC